MKQHATFKNPLLHVGSLRKYMYELTAGNEICSGADEAYSLYFRITSLLVILWLEFLRRRMILLLRTFVRIVYRTLSLTCF